ncbi:hypothetical protein KPZU09_10920 [Klebsiella pneumoniae]|uniref:Benzoate dioxygenase, ferredoxin reductase component n=5 Tax=Bacteria TaxID=2 RepID=A0A919LLL1_KLEPN|nr:hypothetical protein KPZU09_10920 [Klebsiella pneumoniae]
MTFNIALNFEDGVTRFIQCNAGEKVLDAAYRQKVNLPMDCSDGVCGTCKCHCASGEYDLGEDYLDEALSDDEAQARQVLTCQMVPTSDCVIDVPVAAAQCKTALTNTGAQVRQVNLLSDTAIELVVALDEPLAFLPGQYVNIQVPGTLHVRAYSFSSQPGSLEGRFLIRNVPGGMMSQWLTQRARPGDRLTLSGPMGSFYLRHGERPLLMLAGGTGPAPLLSMLHTLQTQGSQRPVMLLYGVTRDCDLVKTDALDTFTQQLTGYRWLPVVADENSTCPQRGFVTDHLDDAMLNNGDVDIYLCGPPPMVNAVATALRDRGSPRRGSGMRNLSPARARRHKETKCVLPIKSSSSPARRRALAARRRSRRLQKARLCCSSIARHTSMSWRRRWRNPAVWCWRWRRIWKRGKVPSRRLPPGSLILAVSTC